MLLKPFIVQSLVELWKGGFALATDDPDCPQPHDLVHQPVTSVSLVLKEKYNNKTVNLVS